MQIALSSGHSSMLQTSQAMAVIWLWKLVPQEQLRAGKAGGPVGQRLSVRLDMQSLCCNWCQLFEYHNCYCLGRWHTGPSPGGTDPTVLP